MLVFSDDFTDSIGELERATRNTPHAIQHYLHIEGGGIQTSRNFEITLESGSPVPVTCESLEAEDIAALIFTGARLDDIWCVTCPGNLAWLC